MMASARTRNSQVRSPARGPGEQGAWFGEVSGEVVSDLPAGRARRWPPPASGPRRVDVDHQSSFFVGSDEVQILKLNEQLMYPN